jgi:hypothetical protein
MRMARTLLAMLTRQHTSRFNLDKEADIMLQARNSMQTTGLLQGGFNAPAQPLLRGDPRNYVIAKADQIVFTAEVVRFGYYPADFALDILRFRGKRSAHSVAATFAMTVENLRTGRRATYLGGPGRTWVTEFVFDLIAGLFGRPSPNRTVASRGVQKPCPIRV